MPCLTLVAARDATTLDDALVARVCDAVRGGPPAILSPGEAVDIPCSAIDLSAVEAVIGDAQVDALPNTVGNRRKGLLIADMDSTIVIGETLDELAAQAGVGGEVAAITARSMNGEIDFAEALRLRTGMLKGLALSALDATWRRTRLTPGARTLVATMRAHGAITALVSGGFTYFTSRVAAELGFTRHYANHLCDDGHALTGEVGEPILDRDAKSRILQELVIANAMPIENTLAVGDGANDLAMLAAAGLGIAYHAKPIVAAAARVRVRHCDLRALLFVQGYTHDRFQD